MPLHSEPHARRAAFCWGVRLAVTLENTPGEETQDARNENNIIKPKGGEVIEGNSISRKVPEITIGTFFIKELH